MRYFIFILVFYNFSHRPPLVKQDKCDLILKILEERHINAHIANHGINSLIRVFDLSGYFGQIKCGYQRYSVSVNNKLMVDLNSGRFIDLCILTTKKEKNITKFEIFYADRTLECKRDFLMFGTLSLENDNGKVTLKESKFESIN